MSFFKRYSRIIGNAIKTPTGQTRAEVGSPAFRVRTMPYLFKSREFGQSSAQSTVQPQTRSTIFAAIQRAWSSPLFKRG